MKKQCKFDARKMMKNRCQNGSQNPWKWFQKSTWSRHWALISRFWKLFERCNNIMICWYFSCGQKKSKKLAQGAFWEAPTVTGNYFLGIWAPGAAPFRAREYLVPRYKGYKVQGTKVQGYKASSKRKQGYFKGSNTPKGQRPGEFACSQSSARQQRQPASG